MCNASLTMVHGLCPVPGCAASAGPDRLCPGCLSELPPPARQALATHRDSAPAERRAAVEEAVRGVLLLREVAADPVYDGPDRPHVLAALVIDLTMSIRRPWGARAMRAALDRLTRASAAAEG